MTSLTRPRPIRAALVSDGNPRDVGTWSGTPFHMLRALERRFDIVHVVERPWARWYRPLGRALKLLSGRRFQYTASRRLTSAAAAGTVAQLAAAQPEVVLAVSCSPLAHALVDRFQVVNIADATVASMLGYYDGFTRSTGGGAGGADALEATLIRGALLSLYPSAWGRASAIDDYGVAPDRALEIAWGVNLPPRDATPRSVPEGILRFLFVGAEWARKGGPLALAVVAELVARGLPCRFDIVGPDAAMIGPVPGNVTVHGFIDKRDPAAAARLEAWFDAATFLLLPTGAECYGMVFAEAASRGLPSISIATGGVPSAVRDGVTGALLPPGSPPAAFADAIQAIVATPDRYAAMSAAALDDARTRLDWNVWAEAVEAAVRARLAA